MSDLYFVILAGGSGERLWPLSTTQKPKQLLAVGGNKTLLDQAINRVSDLAPRENIWVSSTEQHALRIEKAVGSTVGAVTVEPGARNTGPAILFNCFQIYKKNPNAIIFFLPADQFIPEIENSAFAQAVESAVQFVRSKDHITLLGVTPTYPATGYGYIEYDVVQSNPQQDKNASVAQPCSVIRFKEKPSFEIAQQYVQSGRMLWNIGMFCATVSVFMREFKKEAPAMFDSMQRYIDGTDFFDQVPAESIDYAVMEKSGAVSVLPVGFSWCDVGNLEVFLSIKKQYGEKYGFLDEPVCVAAENNFVDVPDKIVALIGVEDLCIVETKKALVIARRGQAEKVRAVVKQLKESGRTDYL